MERVIKSEIKIGKILNMRKKKFDLKKQNKKKLISKDTSIGDSSFTL